METETSIASPAAYVAQTGDGKSKLAAIRTDAEEADEYTIYGDPGDVRSLQWSADGSALFCVVQTLDGSDVYRFRLAFEADSPPEPQASGRSEE